MIILFFPLLLVLLPSAILFLIIKFWRKNKKNSIGEKVALGVGFIILGLILTYLAVIVSIYGHRVNGIQCATGAVVFIPIGLIVNLIGIPLILIIARKGT